MDNIEAKFVKSTISEAVVDLNKNEKNDVLLSVTLEFLKIDGDVTASLKKEIKMNIDYLPENFIPISEITDEMKVQWALESLTEKQKFGIEHNLNKLLKFNAKFKKIDFPEIKNKLDYETSVILQRKNNL